MLDITLGDFFSYDTTVNYLIKLTTGDIELFESMQKKWSMYSDIELFEQQIKEGKTEDVRKALSAIREKYGL